jgi:hypothetical protein
MFHICGAIFEHDGDPNFPHARLKSDPTLCSSVYTMVSEVVQFPNLCQILARDIVAALAGQGIDPEDYDVIVSSSMAALMIGKNVSDLTNSIFAYTEKQGNEQVCRRFKYPAGLRAVQIEELFGRGIVAEKVRRAFLLANPGVEFVEIDGNPVVGAIVLQPPNLKKVVTDHRVVPLFELEAPLNRIADCPHCQGIEPESPKDNWGKFRAHMRQGKNVLESCDREKGFAC